MSIPGFSGEASSYMSNNLYYSTKSVSVTTGTAYPAVRNSGGIDGCPEGTFACACGSTSMCCDAHTEYCWTSPGGSCSCQAKSNSVGGSSIGVFGGGRSVFGGGLTGGGLLFGRP